MNPTITGLEGHSGTSVSYLAIPAVGPDGTNILKLVSVKISPGSQQMMSTLYCSTAQETVAKSFSFASPLSPQVVSVPGILLNNPPPQLLTVSSLPEGQCLRIPPNAHAQTVPASTLPVEIEKQIFNPSTNITPVSPGPVVGCVTPITIVNEGTDLPRNSTLHSPKMPPEKGSKPLLKLIPKPSPIPNGPVRWEIVEEDCADAQSTSPLNSVTSLSLHTVEESERAGQKQRDVTNKAPPESSLGKGEQGQENVFVMSDGGVLIVRKKDIVKKTTDSSTTDKSIIILDDSDEVIDLCDEDVREDLPRVSAGAAAPHQEDDNVIFVSYRPPKTSLQSNHVSGKDVDGLDCQGGADSRDEAGSRSDPGTCNAVGAKCSPAQDKNSQDPGECEFDDHQLRYIFGIDADVKIPLYRIDEVTDGTALSSSHDHHNLYRSCKNQRHNTRRPLIGQTEQAVLAGITRLRCGLFKLNAKSLSALASHSGQLEIAPLTNYVEPIDEDFLTTNENAVAHGQTHTFADHNAKTRVGRTRKRTMCRCCVPGALEPAAKSR